MTFLLSESAAYQLCHNEESYFNGDCYKIFRNRKTWFEANEICEKDGGNFNAFIIFNHSYYLLGLICPHHHALTYHLSTFKFYVRFS